MEWNVNIWWYAGKDEPDDFRHFKSAEDMLAYLDNEAFCLRHECPMPFRVTIDRVS